VLYLMAKGLATATSGRHSNHRGPGFSTIMVGADRVPRRRCRKGKDIRLVGPHSVIIELNIAKSAPVTSASVATTAPSKIMTLDTTIDQVTGDRQIMTEESK
jgi:hypothetical protein